jgi:hypothetical protein
MKRAKRERFEFLRKRVTHGNHDYQHHRCRPSRCRKCGTQMRRVTPSAAPEYKTYRARRWSHLNPGCPPRGSTDKTWWMDRMRPKR